MTSPWDEGRWVRLLADLEAQFDAAEASDQAAEIADRTRREAALLRLTDRLAGALGAPVTVDVLGAGALRGRLTSAGADWLLVVEGDGAEALVPAHAVLSVRGLTVWSRSPATEGAVEAKLDLRHALRGVARSRSGVTVVLIDGSPVTGTIDRVGADFLELAEHPRGEPRRPHAVQDARVIRLAAVAFVRSW